MSPDRDLAMLQFGDFRVNPRARSLHKHGARLKLHGQPFDILLLLLDRPDEVVTREELQAKLWPGDTFVDFEHGLNTAIRKLRQTLGDSAEEPRFIETVPRVGYRFIAQVSVGPAPAAQTSAVPPAAPEVHAESNPSPGWMPQVFASRKRPLLMAAFAVLAILIAASGLYFFYFRAPQHRTQAANARVMLAVLPFENLTGDAAQDYLSDGMTEELISQLGRLDSARVGVIARTSVMYYKDHPAPLERIAGDLGVQYVLEGSLRRDAQQVRVSAQLIQMKDQTHIWAREYDRQLTSLLSVQGEIAQEVADEIQLTLDGSHMRPVGNSQPPSSPSSYEAYDLYLKGRYFWNQRTAAGFRQAVAYFQKSIAKDSHYAPSYAGLADSYAMMASYNVVPQSEVMPQARAAALQALQLDDNLAEAHTSLALIAENYDYDWKTAEREYRRAIQLDPAYPTAYQWYAESLAFQGRFDEAFAESERARQLDPLSLIIASDNGAIFLFSRQYDRAAARLRSVLDMQPDFVRASVLLIEVCVQQKKFTEALAENERLRRAEGQDSASSWAIEAYIYARAGRRAEAERALQKMEQENRRWRLDPLPMRAPVYAAMNRKDEAIACLQMAFAEHSYILTTIKVDPAFDSLRGDPRFVALLRRAGLAR